MGASSCGKKLKQARIRLGLSLREVAKRSDTDYSSLSRLERGEIEITLRRAAALAVVLGLSLDDLAGIGSSESAPRAGIKQVRRLLEDALNRLNHIK